MMPPLLFLLSMLYMFGGENAELNACREAYFNTTSEKDVQHLLSISGRICEKEPAALAYQGAALAMKADYAVNPYKKWSYFNDGKDKIEEAVKRQPSNAEIRFLRLGIQLFTPSFLGYDEAIDEDVDLICAALKKGWMMENTDFRKRIIGFMLTYAKLSSVQRNELELLK